MEEKYNDDNSRRWKVKFHSKILIKFPNNDSSYRYPYKHLNHGRFLTDLSIFLSEIYLYVSNIDLFLAYNNEFSISRSIFFFFFDTFC